jgi:hypothetical protein
VFDAILFEQAGVPAVPIITRPFEPTAAAIAKLHGIDEYACAVVDHPITSLDAAELRERARLAAPQVEAALLVGGAPGGARPGPSPTTA